MVNLAMKLLELDVAVLKPMPALYLQTDCNALINKNLDRVMLLFGFAFSVDTLREFLCFRTSLSLSNICVRIQILRTINCNVLVLNLKYSPCASQQVMQNGKEEGGRRREKEKRGDYQTLRLGQETLWHQIHSHFTLMKTLLLRTNL